MRASINLEHQIPETIALQPEVLNSDDEGVDEEKDTENSKEEEAEKDEEDEKDEEQEDKQIEMEEVP